MSETKLTTRKLISSPVTLPFKVVLVLMILTAAIGSPIALIQQNGLTWWLLLYPLAWAIVFPLLRSLYNLKKVELDSEGLVVSSLLKRARVPFDTIAADAKISQGRGCAFVTLLLTTQCAFGDRIIFMPAMGVSIKNNKDLLLLQERVPIQFKHYGGWQSFRHFFRHGSAKTDTKIAG